MSDINVTVNDEIVNIDVIDEPVLVNVVNSPGQQGPAGPGVPVGGTTGQILAKASATNYDTEWINNYAKYLATTVRNQSGSTIAAFQVVYISGATGNKPLISLADADTEATSSKTYGVTATAIANNGTGDVVTVGELSGIDTSAFTEGDSLWLSTTAGGVVTTPPAEPAHSVFIGTVIRSHPTLGVIDVAIQNGYELNELHGVLITSAANNQGLFYNSGNGLWENKSIATALGYTPANAATTLTINGVTYDLSANRSWTISAGISGSGTATYLSKFTDTTTLGNSLLRETTNAIALGKAPSAWITLNAFQVQNASLAGWSNNLYLYANAFYDGSNPRYINNGFSTYYEQNSTSGTHIWYVAGTGTSGNVISYTTPMSLTNSGRLLIGTTTDDGVNRLQVSGNALIKGSGNTGATTALTVQNSDSSNILRVRNNGWSIFGASNAAPYIYPSTSLGGIDVLNGANLVFYNQHEAADMGIGGFMFTGATYSRTSGNASIIGVFKTFAPTSGTAIYNHITLSSTINQTGGANGVTRGLYVNPTLTAAADFRAIETTAGNVLFGSNFFWDNTNGRLGVNRATPIVAFDVASTFNGAITPLSVVPDSATTIFLGNTGTNAGLAIGQNNTTQSWLQARSRLASQPAYQLLLQPLGGNVLVGGTSDDGVNRLQVSGNAKIDGTITPQSITFAANGNIRHSTGAYKFQEFYDGGTASNSFLVAHPTVGLFNFGFGQSTAASIAGTSLFNFVIARTGAFLRDTLSTSTSPNASSVFELSSTTRGFLPPRMTTTQKNAIASPAAGLVVYDTTDNKHYGYNGTTWNAFY